MTVEDLECAVYVASGYVRTTDGRIIHVNEILPLLNEAAALCRWTRLRGEEMVAPTAGERAVARAMLGVDRLDDE